MLAFGMPGHWEWVVILIVALLLFGKRLPEVIRAVARSLVGFRHEMDKAKREIEAEESAARPPVPPPADAEDKPSGQPPGNA
jgi:sec-independent protein translocase protein TatA